MPRTKLCGKNYELGIEDGRAGKSADRIKRYLESCPKEGLVVREDRYTYGRQVGLAEYCSASRGEKDASKGVRDSICLQEKIPPYQTAYLRQIKESREARTRELKKLREQQSQLESEINSLDEQKTVVQ